MTAALLPDATWDYSRPALRLERLLRRNAVVFQAVFATFWAVRFAVVAGPWEVPVLVLATSALATRRAFRNTPGLRARDEFRSPRGRAFLRPVTRLTLWQVAGSVVLPVAVAATGRPEWVAPSVALTIALFLVGFGRQLQLGGVRILGGAATIGCLVLPLVTSGDTLIACVAALMTTTLCAALLLCARGTR